MNRKNRCLALFLAIAFVFTNSVSHFGNILVKANEETDGAPIYDKTVFDNIDVTGLDAKGFTSTKFSRSGSGRPYNAVSGETDQPASKHWFSGNGTDTPYYKDGKKVSGILAENIGIKPRTNSDNDRYLLTTPYSFGNFKLTEEVYWGAVTGVVMGEKNVFPNNNADPAITVYFNANQIQLNGAVDFSTAVVTGAGAAKSVSGSTLIFKPASIGTVTKAKVYKLNVSMENGVLSVWLTGYTGVLTVKCTADYSGNTVSVLGRKFGGDSGGIKSFEIRDLSSFETTEFDNADVNTLDTKGFVSKKFFKNDKTYDLVETADSVSNHWFSGNGTDTPYYKDGKKVSGILGENIGLKPNTNNDYDRYLLVSPYTYENFSISEEIYYGIQTGIVLGKKDAFPDNASAACVAIYFNNNKIQISGGVDLSSAAVTGENAASSVYNNSLILFTFDSSFTGSAGKIYTLNAEVSGGVLTVWVDGYNGVLTVNLASNYANESISVMSRKFGGDNGGIKSFSIKDMTRSREEASAAEEGDGFSYDFLDASFNTSDLNTDFVSYYFETAGSKNVYKADALWTTSAKGGNTSSCLKPTHKVDGSKYTLLTYDRYLFKNVDISAEYLYNTAQYSIMIAPEGALSSPAGGIKVWVESTGIIKISGSVDAGSAQAAGGMVKINGGGNSVAGYAISGYKALGTPYTLHVKIDGDVLYTWMDEYPDYIISVRLTENYSGGVVSLCSTGYNSGGFGSFSAYEISASQDTGNGKTYTQSFSALTSLSELDNFTAYTLDSAANSPKEADISDAFVLKKGRLQSNQKEAGKDDRTNFSILTFNKKSYKNFELTLNFEQNHMQRYGVMFGGDMGEFAYTVKGSRLQGNGGAYVYTEAEGYRNIRGSLYTSSYTSAKEALSRNKGEGQLKSFYYFGSDLMKNIQQSAIHSMKIRVVGDTMTMTVDNDESSRVTVKLSEYTGGYISLVTDSNAGSAYGAFDYFSITELDDNAELGAEEPAISNGYETLNQADGIFDAYHLTDAKQTNTLEKVDMKERWWINNGGVLTRTKSANGYSVTEDVDILTYTKQKYTDFEMTYTYQQNWLRIGVAFGEEPGKYPLYYENGKIAAKNGAVVFLEAEGYTNVQGNIKNMSSKNEKLYRISKPSPAGFKDDTGNVLSNISAKKEHTVKIVVKNKKLYVFIDGSSAPSCYAELGDSYSGGYVSVFAHSSNSYGFKDFSIDSKIDTDLSYAAGAANTANGISADFDCTKFDDSAFTSYYLDNVEYNPEGRMKKQNFYDCWTIVNGVLKSNNTKSGTDVKDVSVLTYNKKLNDFIVTYDYQKTPQRMMLIFGAEKGKYPIAATKTTERINSGALLYPENDLGAGGGIVALGNIDPLTSKYRPSARKTMSLNGYHDKNKWASNVGIWHTMTVAVVNKQVYVYIDDYGMIATFGLTEDYAGGYVSLATSGSSAAFDNLTVTDLSDMPLNGVISVVNPDDITVKTGTDISSLKLPSTVKVNLKNGKTAQLPVNWTSAFYDGNTAGTYRFTAVPSSSPDAVNPGRVGALLEVKVVETVPANDKAVKRWDFDTQNDLKDFKAFYLKNAEIGYITKDIPKWYISNDGRLSRDPFRAVAGDQYKEIAILTYTGERYNNFELEVDYTQAWTRMMVMFGSEKIGNYVDLNDIYAEYNPVAAFIEMEGARNFIGNLRNANFDSNDKEKINNSRESGIRATNYYDKVLAGGNAGKVHTMKIRVVGDQASMWVDDVNVPYSATLTNYDGGYISLVSTTKNGFFDNLKITRLNELGEKAVEENEVLANGKVSVSIDPNASPELILDNKNSESSKDDLTNAGSKPVLSYVIGASVILLAAVVGAGSVLIVKKKYRK